tara:strand:- start:1148 stop:1852 length:705 start_codon:yes stop_codon:yes gene_type:complete
MAELRVKSTGTLKLFENDNTSNVTIASPASLGADRTVTLPDADVTLVSGTMSTGFAVTDITGQTALGATPADTDEFVLSDAGVLKRVDYSYLKTSNTPAFHAQITAAQDISNNTDTKVAFDQVVFNTGGGTYDAVTNYRWTPGVAGEYYVASSLRWNSADEAEQFRNTIKLDGSSAIENSKKAADWGNNNFSGIVTIGASGYIECWTYQNSGGTISYSDYDPTMWWGAFLISGA